jgi:uncharacterized protein (TIGR03790 family)
VRHCFFRFWVVACLALTAALASAQSVPSGEGASAAAPGAASSAPEAVASEPVVRQWMRVPRVYGHLTAQDLGVVINLDDPYSVQVGEHYVKARRIPADQVLRLHVPVKGTLSIGEFADLSAKIDAFYGNRVQGLALAWRWPFAVDCNAITGALAMGFDAKLCASTCAVSRQSSYFGSISSRPFHDHRMRISMLLAARDVAGAKAMIDRGVRSDGTLGLRGATPVHAHFVTTSDAIRSVRQVQFPPEGLIKPYAIELHLDQTDALRNASRVVMYLTGRASVDGLDTVRFVPGALADHLTSFGGILDRPMGQMNVLSWIEAGATASYGTTSEPCAHLQKFPQSQALLQFYLQGATALEAYWKSVAWPQQGLFVGEPLAAPFFHPR